MTEGGHGGRRKADLEIEGNLDENKGECDLEVKALGNGEDDL